MCACVSMRAYALVHVCCACVCKVIIPDLAASPAPNTGVGLALHV